MALRRYCEGLLLLLLGVGFATLASTGHLPWLVVAAATALYAVRAYGFLRRQEIRLPGRALSVALLLYVPLFACDGLMLSGNWLDASLHAVVLIGAAKAFSKRTGRDFLALGLFAFLEVLAAAVLTVSGIFFVLFLLFLVVLVGTLVAHEMMSSESAAGHGRGVRPATTAARAGTLLRFSLLLSGGVAMFTVLFFFLLPRTTLGAWGAHRAESGLSGFSDDVQLGAIAGLQRTDNVVMHIRPVVANGAAAESLPEEYDQLLWRGRGLTSFDGRRWFDPNSPSYFGTADGRFEIPGARPLDLADIIRYQVTLEPMASPVLFFPSRLLGASTRFPVLGWENSTDTLTSPVERGEFVGAAYSGVSDVGGPDPDALRRAPALNPQRMRYSLAADLQLPDELDPRVRTLARSIVAGGPLDNYDRMQRLAAFLRDHYQYSLDNLPGGRDPLAAFLFEDRAGDCEYFASALAVMGRTLGIPTRVVNGFLGGTYNPLSGEYVVRGRDAHSWVEAYFPVVAGGGRSGPRYRGSWVSFDATPAADATSAQIWPGAGMVLDALSSLWQEWIVNYDWVRQAGVARGLQSSLNDAALAAWQNGAAAAAAAWSHLGGGGEGGAGVDRSLALASLCFCLLAAAILGLGAPLRRWRRDRAEPATRRAAKLAYARFQRHLAAAGMEPRPAQTSEELLAALASRRGDSPLLAAARSFVGTYQAVRFGDAPPARLAQLGAELRAVRRHARG